MADRVIFFDIDGTLLSTGGAGQQAMEQALREDFRIQHPLGGILTAGRTDFGITSEIFERYQVADTPEARVQFRDGYLARLRSNMASRTDLLLPGVLDLLRHVSGVDNLSLSLLTGNYRSGAEIKLTQTGIDQYFVSGGFGDDFADRDDVARQALASWRDEVNGGVLPAKCMVIGDTPADIQCARAIGAVAVGVATGHYSSEELNAAQPDCLFTDFSAPFGVGETLLELL